MPPCHGGGRGFESRPDRKSLKLFLRDFFFDEILRLHTLFRKRRSLLQRVFSTDVEMRLGYHLNSQHKFTSQAKDWVNLQQLL